jgi:putative Holliday junction resolvase
MAMGAPLVELESPRYNGRHHVIVTPWCPPGAQDSLMMSAAVPQAFPMLGLDVSEQRIGLALAEHPTAPPTPLFTYARTTRARDLAQCADWVARFGVQMVVVGVPLNQDGTLGPRARWAAGFARDLQRRLPVTVVVQDERLSTVEADERLALLTPAARAERQDAVAAAIILERALRAPDEDSL